MAGRPATLKVDIVADAKGVGPGVSSAESRFGRMGGVAAKAGKAVAVGLGAAVVAVGALGAASVQSASDQQQAFGALGSVYGKNAAQVRSWARGASSELGLSATSYANLSAVVGSQLKNMGRSQAEAAAGSDALIHKGADLAATFGGSVSDAVSAVGSLLRGERDPIERYGVSINQAAIDAEVASMGLGNLTGASLKQAQATATLTLLNRQTADSTGAFAKESNTLAGQQERLKAEFDNAKAALGSRLIPALTLGVKWVREELAPAVTQLWQRLSQNLGPAISAVGGFIMGTLVPAARSMYQWFVEKIAPGIVAAVTPVVNGLRSAFANVGRTVDDNREGLQKIGTVLRVVAEFIATKVAPVVGTVLGGAFRVLGRLIGDSITTISTLANVIGTVVSKLHELASAVKSSPVGKLGGALGGLFGGPPLAIGAPSLTRPGSYAVPAGLATAGLATAALGSLDVTRGTSGGSGGFLTVIDRRTIDARVVVEGDLLDVDGAARKLDRLAGSHARRVGRATTYAPVIG